ncbi:MAG: hypothetical protein P8Y71_24210 [Pseudolabrys sp.]
MTDETNDQTNDAIIAFEISDAALEAAARAGNQRAYTVVFCTSGTICPA